MSPQTRRGRATPASHQKPPTRKPAAPPSAAVDAEEPVEAVKPLPRRTTATANRRGLARVRRSSMLYSFLGYVRVYIPLLAVFALVFGGVWAWVSFGPHTPTPSQNWTRIQDQWKPKRDVDLQKIGAAVNDFNAQMTAYKSLHDDTKGWMDALAKVTDWTDAKATGTFNSAIVQDMQAFTSAGNTEVAELETIGAMTAANDVLAEGSTLQADEANFTAAYETIYYDFFGNAVPSLGPSLALPSGSLSPSLSPGASASPGASPSPGASTSPGASISPGASPS